MTSKIYQVSCHKCEKRFNTSFALKQHLVKSHSIRTLPKRISFVIEGIEAPLPKPQRISKRAGPYHAYKTWRESVLKGINNAHHPRPRGNFEYHTSIYHMFYMFVWASHVVVLCFEELEVAIDFTLFFNIQQNGINRSSISFQLSSSDSF